MAKLSLDQAVVRFQENDERIDKFANGNATSGYNTTAGVAVPSIQKFLAEKNAEIDADLSGVFNSDGASLVGYMPAGTGAVATNVQAKLRENVSVKDFGAVGDGVSDDTAYIQLAVDYLNTVSSINPLSLVFPPGKYLVTDEIDFSATGGERREIIGGTGFETAKIMVNFSGHDKYVFKFGNPNSPAYQRAVSIKGFEFSKVNSAHRSPIGIGGNALSQSRISNIIFGSWNNTAIELYAPQNTRNENITLFSGGHSWDYKTTTGITALQAGTTLTASSSLFSASDVGHTIALWGSSPNFLRRKTRITAYTSPTVVTVSTSYTDSTPLSIYFGCPLVSISATSTTMTADAPCFSSADVGLTVYIKGAGADARMHRAKIAAYISATQVTLSAAAVTTVSLVEFGCPAIDVHSVGAAAGQGGSDNSFDGLQIENHRGLGMVLQNQDQLTFAATKIHSEQTVGVNRFSICPLWIDQASGNYQGSFDAQYIGEEKLYAVYQTSVFNIESAAIRTAYDEIILRVGPRATGYEGGLVQLDDLSLLGASPNTTTYSQIIIDANAPIPGYVLSGKMSNSINDRTRVYTGNRFYGDSSGGVSFEDTNGTIPLLRVGDYGTGSGGGNVTPANIVWNGTAPSGTLSGKYRWQRIGNIVFFDYRLLYAVAGITNSGLVITLESGMPAPLAMSGTNNGETLISTGGYLFASATAAPSLTKAYFSKTGGGATLNLALNSGTISALGAFSTGCYFTA